MTLKNPKLFGLNVLSLLADVQSKNTAIRNLGLNPLDLEVIRGSKNAGMDRDDWISFSRLRTPIYKTLDRFLSLPDETSDSQGAAVLLLPSAKPFSQLHCRWSQEPN